MAENSGPLTARSKNCSGCTTSRTRHLQARLAGLELGCGQQVATMVLGMRHACGRPIGVRPSIGGLSARRPTERTGERDGKSARVLWGWSQLALREISPPLRLRDHNPPTVYGSRRRVLLVSFTWWRCFPRLSEGLSAAIDLVFPAVFGGTLLQFATETHVFWGPPVQANCDDFR